MRYELVKTCDACPEQYDVFDKDGNQVAYFRLRHGMFRVDYPDCGGETIYYVKTESDGIFYDEEEREYHFKKAFAEIDKKLLTFTE